ncbi:MAG: UDP-N-acetylglucosamine pyrophosphorylase [Syntrophales bacterium]|nr:UDP-N-acetylglucosamine pyrophosphorylase [Syntrophales bacterium]
MTWSAFDDTALGHPWSRQHIGAMSKEAIEILKRKGVTFLHPDSVYIGAEVVLENFAGEGVVIFPHCRIMGDRTVIGPFVELGREGPVTIENCRVGRGVKLRGGYFRESVFLPGVEIGGCAQVREGCILEEQARCAHSVGLKQTILFPFVTLGSLINFCDCLMAGGTDRENHSEVGSSYIHFNFTPRGDKATPSLIGDVPRGVMLREKPIFLGGQGGIVGPLRIEYGVVVAAGTILRRDVLEQNVKILPVRQPTSQFGKTSRGTYSLERIFAKNVNYIANLFALKFWYRYVREPFFLKSSYDRILFNGALETLEGAIEERKKRLRDFLFLVSKREVGYSESVVSPLDSTDFSAYADKIDKVFSDFHESEEMIVLKEEFLHVFSDHLNKDKMDYVTTIKSIPFSVAQLGTQWLKTVVDGLWHLASKAVPVLNL